MTRSHSCGCDRKKITTIKNKWAGGKWVCLCYISVRAGAGNPFASINNCAIDPQSIVIMWLDQPWLIADGSMTCLLLLRFFGTVNATFFPFFSKRLNASKHDLSVVAVLHSVVKAMQLDCVLLRLSRLLMVVTQNQYWILWVWGRGVAHVVIY